MMRQLVLFWAILAVATAGAAGASITVLQPMSTAGDNYSGAYSISEDGRYISGRVTDSYDTALSAAVYDVTGGAWTSIPSGGSSIPLCGNAWGVAHRTGGGLFVGVDAADNGGRTYATTNQFGRVYQGGDANSRMLLGPAGEASETMVGYAGLDGYPGTAGNSMAAFADGSDAWVCGQHRQGSTPRGNGEGLIWKQSSTTPYAKVASGTTPAILMGMSSTGRAVGVHNPSVKRAIYADAGAGGSITPTNVPLSSNADLTKNSIAYGISDDGNYILGQQFITGYTRAQAFMYKNGDANAVILNGMSGAPNANEQSFAADATNDGFVVGYTWSSTTSSRACVWLPDDPTHTAIQLYTYAQSLGIDMTGWTVGMGSGVGSVTKIGSQYYIVGTGTWNDGTANRTRGYLIITPEPATLGLLILGGFAALRRRH